MIQSKTIPVFRIFDYPKAIEFYVQWLGFVIDWEHALKSNAPRYLQVSKGEIVLHLTEHHGDCTPGSKAFIEFRGLKRFHEELLTKEYAFNRPGLEDAPWNALVMEVTDPFGNKLLFNESRSKKLMTFQKHVDLTPFNTFGIRALAKAFTTVRSLNDAQELIATDTFQNQKTLILGGGSNILLTKNFDGLVIKIEITGIKAVAESDEEVTLKVGSGENWHEVVMHCVERNWGGIENLSLIPGTVGAAPMQNIGAYGAEVKDVIEQVEALEISTGLLKNFSNAECQFGYRDSIFKHQAKGKYIITSVTFRLTKKNHRLNTGYGAVQETITELGYKVPTVKAISDAVIHIRKSKLPDPSVIGNAGSFFKNPSVRADLHDFLKKTYPTIPGYPTENKMIKIPAAWLIEQCGWKGKTFNKVGVHQHQALVLVNYGGGEGEKIWQLALKIQSSVKEKFNITLQPEVNVI